MTIKQPTTSSTPISNCVSYTWNNVTYTASGTYTKSGLTNAAGCDSIAYLVLNIKQPTTSTTTVSNCGSYIWNGTTYTTTGSYTKKFTNAAGCDSTATLNLTVTPITGAKTTTAACGSYTWSSNNTVYTQSGTYYYTLRCRRDTLVLTINAKPTNVVITSSTSVCGNAIGNQASANATGTGLTYTWTITNGTITSGNGSATIVYTAGVSGSVTLGVTATTSAGCSTLATPKTVSILAAPNATITVPTSVCPSATAVTASVSSSSESGATYVWSITNGTITSGSGTYSIKFTAGASGTVTLSVRVTSKNGCYTIGNATVTLAALATPVVTASGSTSLCTGGSVILTAPSGYTYLWSSGQTTQSITVSAAGSYTVRVTNTIRCTATSAAITVTVNALPTVPVITASGSTTICQGGSVTLTSSTAASYLWSTGATTQSITVNTGGIYFVKVYNAAGCSATSVNNTVTVNPPLTPTIVISSNATGIISGNSFVTFTSTITGGGTNPVYQWKKNGVNVGSNISTYTNNVWSNGDVVTCVLTSNYPCATIASVTSNSISLSVSNVSVPKFLIVDVTQNRGYYYDSSFNFISSNAMSTGTLYGVTNASDVHANGGYVYVSDAFNMRLYRSNAPATVSTVSKTLKTLTGSNISSLKGLTINGDTLWVLDQYSKAIYRYSLTAAFSGTGSINALAKINISNEKGESLFADKGNLYVLDDYKDRSLYRYNKSGSTSNRSKIMKTSAGLALGSGTGAVIDANGRVWVTDQINDKSYSYSMSSLFSGTGNLNASSEFTLLNSTPTNANATGITLVNSTTMLRITTNPVEYVISKPESFQYEIYPNPTTRDYHMIVKSSKKSVAIKARILDLQGRIIKTFAFNSNETIEFGNDLKAGVYMVEVREGKEVKTIRVVKY